MTVISATPTQHGAPADVLTGRGVAVELTYLGRDEVAVRITTPADEVSTDAGADLLARAVSRARDRHQRVVRTALDASGPSAGVMLDALRTRVSGDVGAIDLRRAGSSVMVTLHLNPVRPARRAVHDGPGQDGRTGGPRPSQPPRRSRRRGSPTAAPRTSGPHRPAPHPQHVQARHPEEDSR